MYKHISAWNFSDEDLKNGSCKSILSHYSRMKHGSIASTKVIAHRFVKDLLNKHKDLIANQEVVVIPAPYNGVSPIASSNLAKEMFWMLIDNNLNTKFYWDTIKREQGYIADYQHMSHKDRIAALADDPFKAHKEYLGNKTLLFIDDVNITGAHAQRIEEMLEQHEMLENKSIIAAYGQYTGSDPTTEAVINHYDIKTQKDLVNLSYEPDFEMTLRGAKFILKLEGNAFEEAFTQLSYHGKQSMWKAMLGKFYHKHEMFVNQTQIIRKVLTNVY